MVRVLFRIFLFVVLAAFIFFFLGNWLLARASETIVEKVTGFPTHISSLKFNLPNSIHIKGLQINNPSGFQKKLFAEIPEIYVNLDVPALIKKDAIHLREIRLDLQQVNIEKNVSGTSNIGLLSALAKKKSTEEKPAAESAQMPFLLDKLVLSIRKVSYADASGIIPTNVATDLHIQAEEFTNIKSPLVLVNLIIYKIIKGTTFGNLGIDTAFLDSSVAGAFQLGSDVVKLGTTLTHDAANILSTHLTTAQEVSDRALNTASSTANTAKKKVTGILGGIKNQVYNPSSSSTTDTSTATTQS